MAWVRSRQIPVWIITIFGLIIALNYFFDVPILSAISSEVQTWAVLIAAFAMGLGFVNLVKLHSNRVVKRTDKWYLSAWLLVMCAVMIVSGLVPPITKHVVFSWIFTNVNTPSGGSMYAILAFFITSAAYRTFRAKNIEATLLLIAGFFTMFTKAPIGDVIWPGFKVVGSWLLNVPNLAGTRGITIGIALGVMALGIRTLAGIERKKLFGSE